MPKDQPDLHSEYYSIQYYSKVLYFSKEIFSFPSCLFCLTFDIQNLDFYTGIYTGIFCINERKELPEKNNTKPIKYMKYSRANIVAVNIVLCYVGCNVDFMQSHIHAYNTCQTRARHVSKNHRIFGCRSFLYEQTT